MPLIRRLHLFLQSLQGILQMKSTRFLDLISLVKGAYNTFHHRINIMDHPKLELSPRTA